MNNSLLTVKEVAAQLKISTSTVYRLCKRGLPHIHKTFGIRIQEEALDRWTDQDQSIQVLSEKILQNALTKIPPVDIDKAKGGIEVARSSRSRRNYGYGSVYVRITSEGISRYYIDYRNKRGKRIQKLVKQASSWEMAEDALKAAVFNEFYAERKTQKKKITFRSWSKVYQRDYSSFNKSWKEVEYMMKPLIVFFKDTELRQIVPSAFQRFIKSRQKIGNLPATLNRYISLVKRMMNVAIEEGYLEDNPVKIKKFSEEDREKTRVISEEEEATILKNSYPQLRSFLIIALNTGMRAGEIYRLTWKQADLPDRMITVEKTKSGRVRQIPINEGLFQELVRIRNRNTQSEYLFYNPRTGRPITSMKKAFAGALKRSGLSGIRIHDYRHSAASRWIRSGVDIQTVKELLGHADITTTMRYVHTNVQAKRKAVDLLESRPICYTTVTREKGESTAQLQSPFFSVN